MSLFRNPFVLALTTLIGTIIGAGIFAMPYVLAQSGAIPFLIYFFVLAGVVWLLHLLVGEIALRTKESHRLIGYGKIYFGSRGKTFFTFTTVFSVVGALLAYVVIGGTFLHVLISPFNGLSAETASIAFWAVLSFFIIRGINTISKTELIMNIALFGAVALILSITLPELDSSNLVVIGNANIFLPFGVLLFAFAGWNAIPEIAELFKKKSEKRNLDNVIAWAAIATLVVYGLFAFSIVGVTGANTSDDALSALLPMFGDKLIALGAFFGLISIAASYLVLGNYLKNSLRYDYGMRYSIAAAIAILAPIILFAAGIREFVAILAVVGGVATALEGMGIIVMHRKAQQKSERDPEYRIRLPKIIGAIIILLFLAGAILELIG